MAKSPMKLIDDIEFVQRLAKTSTVELAYQIGCTDQAVQQRRKKLETKLKRPIHVGTPAAIRSFTRGFHPEQHPGRITHNVTNGVVLIGSDLHIWPGPVPTMHRAFVHFIKEMEPKAVILNGDVVDMAGVSRHPPIGWEKQPTVQEEIEAAQDRLDEINQALPRGTPRVWTWGNHDNRFETRLATVAPEYAKVHGVHLKDHFPGWEPCWSVWINDDVVVKHRFKGGVHAPWNNTINSGKTTVTGHLHSAKVTPFTDYNGTRYGVDTGCMADTNHAAFVDYTEDSPKNWRSAFCVLTFRNSKLLFPELVVKWDEDHVQFRGEIIKV